MTDEELKQEEEKEFKLNMMDLYPNSPWEKLLVKLPILSWRMGLGPVTGQLFLVLTSTGRKSGLPRRTMMEYSRMGGKKYSPCPFGERANWYQNIVVDPQVTVQSADGTERMKAVRVTEGKELLSLIEHGLSTNPMMLKWYFNSLGIDFESEEDILAHKDKIFFIRFDPVEEITPPGLEVDLAWIWPLLLLFSLGRRRKRRK
jgi:deazaflavin-dependent oxidoreductase (nitroreductase family)